MDHAKRSFHRSVNSIFGKLVGTASEDIILHLVHRKCLPILIPYTAYTIYSQQTLSRPRDTV